jgi:hypothetical protein
MKKIAAECDGVPTQDFRQTDIVSEDVAVGIIKLVNLSGAAAAWQKVVVAPMQSADVVIPGHVLERGGVVQQKMLARVNHRQLICVVLVISVERQGAIEACRRLAEGRAVRLEDALVRGGNHRWTVAAPLGIVGAKGEASGGERFDGFAVR